MVRDNRSDLPFPWKFVKDATPEDVSIMYHGQVEGAILNGSRVEKTKSVPGDSHQDGARATVTSSIKTPDPRHPGTEAIAYWVTWDDHPGIGCFIVGDRIRAVV